MPVEENEQGKSEDWYRQQGFLVAVSLGWAEDVPAPNRFIEAAKYLIPRKIRLTTFNPSLQDIYYEYLTDLAQCKSGLSRFASTIRFNIELLTIFVQSLGIWLLDSILKVSGRLGVVLLWVLIVFYVKRLLS
ncbi:hypothetical protein RBWH47_03307 [Rhodopirellula baltica WH47]|uniref:Uncharacterized protein n=1 Tax=Rhodopirellula baltica WH47 TaxID=991778 RepID=F2ASH7_RHOBT|nr:hypothetical protein RBWH47_03307 [Rhodopirellula baltica WH47]